VSGYGSLCSLFSLDDHSILLLIRQGRGLKTGKGMFTQFSSGWVGQKTIKKQPGSYLEYLV
jgi:hypothetical protein